jgi:hypothetical protein
MLLSTRNLAVRLGLVVLCGLAFAAFGIFGGGDDESEPERGLTTGREDEVLGGYFGELAVTVGQVELVRADAELGDDVSDDDIAQSTEAACFALDTWPGEEADALLNQGQVSPEEDWEVAPQVAVMTPDQLIYFVQSAQANLCPDTAERIRLELCELSPAEIEEGVEC